MTPTLVELMKNIWVTCPDASFGEDNSGQLVIYTDMKVILGELEEHDVLIPLDL